MLRKARLSAVVGLFTETFGLGRGAATAAVAVIALTLAAAAYLFFESAPPRSLTITSGPPGSVFERYALIYSNALARDHVRVKVAPSQGSEENLARLGEPHSKYMVGFVQGGVVLPNSDAAKRRSLNSLGSVMYEPLMVFHRASATEVLLSDFAGKRLAVGLPGSGAHALATLLLATNGIVPGGATALLEMSGDEGVTNLLAGAVDAVFLMSDSVSTNTLRRLLRDPKFALFSFVQADAYVRRIPYLNKLLIPRGGLDLGKDVPPKDIQLVGPTVELIAAADLHPALSDLLLEAAREAHSKPSMLQQRGEFPAPMEHDFKLSPAAVRYYRTGKSWLYKNLPFALAGVVEGVVALIVPIAIVLIPGLKLIPTLMRWRVKLILFRWYRALQAVERGLFGKASHEARADLLSRLDAIEASVKELKLPSSYADQYYGLRGHIVFVREKLGELAETPAPKV